MVKAAFGQEIILRPRKSGKNGRKIFPVI